MSFMTFIVYLLLVLPLPLTLATGAVSYVSQFDVAYYERQCQHYFSKDCPVHDHDSWLCSKILTNCTSPDYPYHCVLNTAGKVVHVCAAAQICLKGTVPIFDPRTHMVSCKNCSKGYYQPVDIWSNNTPVCMVKFGCDNNYHKIECTVEPEKELTQDTLCRCDARNDYILSFSEGREICVPGKFADCYELKCPDGQERLLNYTCAPRCDEGFQRDDSDICVPKYKSTVITTTEGDKATQTTTASIENFSKGSISENDVIIATSVIFPSLAIILIIAIVLCWKRRDRCRPFSPVPSDDPEAGTISNAQTDDPEAGTMSNAQSDDREAGTMSNDQLCRRVLNRCLPDLMYLNFKVVMMHIQQKEIFDDLTTRDIMEQPTTSKGILMLIENLKLKPQTAYEKFKECLFLAGQEHLNKKLEEFEEKNTNEIGETHQAQDTVNVSLDVDVSSPGNSLDAV